MLKGKYKEYADINFTENPTGMCALWTKKLCEIFPELIRVRGHYYCAVWGEREHWWCKTQEGLIIDPTVDQFLDKLGEYVELPGDVKEPIGICLECGAYCYEDGNFCCDEHRDSYTAYIMTGVL